MKTALITGATGGLGEALTQVLVNQGFATILTGTDEKKLYALASKFGSEYLCCDLAIPTERKKLIHLIHHRIPELVINNAGFGLYGEAISLSIPEQLALFELNAAALLEISLESGKALRKHHCQGTILNISSIAGEYLCPHMAVYAASKTFVTKLTQTLDYESRPHGIRYLVALPGQIRTSFATKAAKSAKPLFSPLQMSPEKVARALYRQITQGKGFQIIDFRYRLLHLLSKLLPTRLSARRIEKGLRQRLKH